MPEPYPTAGHPDEIDYQVAEEFGREMVIRSMKISAGETDLIPAPPEDKPIAPPPMPDAPEGGSDAVMNVIGTYSRLLKFKKEKCLYPEHIIMNG